MQLLMVVVVVILEKFCCQGPVSRCMSRQLLFRLTPLESKALLVAFVHPRPSPTGWLDMAAGEAPRVDGPCT